MLFLSVSILLSPRLAGGGFETVVVLLMEDVIDDGDDDTTSPAYTAGVEKFGVLLLEEALAIVVGLTATSVCDDCALIAEPTTLRTGGRGETGPASTAPLVTALLLLTVAVVGGAGKAPLGDAGPPPVAPGFTGGNGGSAPLGDLGDVIATSCLPAMSVTHTHTEHTQNNKKKYIQ